MIKVYSIYIYILCPPAVLVLVYKCRITSVCMWVTGCCSVCGPSVVLKYRAVGLDLGRATQLSHHQFKVSQTRADAAQTSIVYVAGTMIRGASGVLMNTSQEWQQMPDVPSSWKQRSLLVLQWTGKTGLSAQNEWYKRRLMAKSAPLKLLF